VIIRPQGERVCCAFITFLWIHLPHTSNPMKHTSLTSLMAPMTCNDLCISPLPLLYLMRAYTLAQTNEDAHIHTDACVHTRPQAFLPLSQLPAPLLQRLHAGAAACFRLPLLPPSTSTAAGLCAGAGGAKQPPPAGSPPPRPTLARREGRAGGKTSAGPMEAEGGLQGGSAGGLCGELWVSLWLQPRASQSGSVCVRVCSVW